VTLVRSRSHPDNAQNMAQGFYMKRYISYFTSICILGSSACSDSPEDMSGGADSGVHLVMDTSIHSDGGTAADVGMIDGGPPPTKMFKIRIQNNSQNSALSTALSSGVWATHADNTPFFSDGEVDRAEGLKMLAEDGDATSFAASVSTNPLVTSSGGFGAAIDMPAEGAEAVSGLAVPGQAFEFMVSTNALAPNLSFASMVVESNDLFLAPGSGGVRLFSRDGTPLSAEDITANIELWDLGTEANEAPGSGKNQAPRQVNPGDGNPEGVVHPFNYSTRSLPLAIDILNITAEKVAEDTVRLTVSNVSGDKGAFLTNLSPVFWASHSEAWTLFTEKISASAGLARMVEDGILTDLQTEHATAAGVGIASAEADKAGPGESYTFDVTASIQNPLLTFAIGLSECNDAFVALPPSGIGLFDDTGLLRSAVEIADEINRRLIVWDAGSERNEPPGVGPNQVSRQSGPTGSPDAVAEVRRYKDTVNDLEGPRVGGIINLNIEGDITGDFNVILENTSGSSGYPTNFSPLVWLLHDGSTKIFANGSPATPQLEMLAEDGNPDGLKGELNAMANVTAEILRTPDGAGGLGLEPGQRYVWTVRPNLTQRSFNFATMIKSSNDSILALGPDGVALLDSGGQPRSNNDIAADIAAKLAAWDAGTEGNQAGGAGPDQGSNQSASGRGPSEGSGLVRKYSNELWSYPQVKDLVTVTVTPID
jgi:hypothetical protein